MINAVDLERALAREKRRQSAQSPDEILAQYEAMLRKDDEVDEAVLRRIFGAEGKSRNICYSRLDPQRIYHVDHIRSLCTRYRLRFLDARLFKGEIPYEAISHIKHLQQREEVELSGFKLMAPAPMFQLENKDRDPLLFATLGKGHFYLVHKWGKDLHPLRALAVLPFRNFKSLLFTLASLALLVVSCIPSSVMMGPYDQSSLGIRVIFFFYLFIAFCGLTALYGFSRLRDFNANLWDSKYLD